MKNFPMRFTGVLALPLLLIMPMAAQTANPQAGEPGITRQQADQILEELRQIRQLLQQQQAQQAQKPQAPPAPSRAQMNLQGAEMLGSKNAPITVVEFTDYQCPFCQRFHVATFAEMKKNFIDTGKVRFFSRDLPLDTIHPNAMRAAMAVHCAGDQGHFWQFRDQMASHPDKLELNNLVDAAGAMQMNPDTFRSCVESSKYKDTVQGSVLEAMKFGIGGTPSFVIGKSTAEGVDGEVVEGALPLSEFAKVFAKLEH